MDKDTRKKETGGSLEMARLGSQQIRSVVAFRGFFFIPLFFRTNNIVQKIMFRRNSIGLLVLVDIKMRKTLDKPDLIEAYRF